ncbi:MAG: pyridoxal-phosphate dependent enzyme [Pseudomonadota bacterium]
MPIGYSYLGVRYPRVAAKLPRLPIGNFPTPLTPIGDADTGLWIKRDDLTHTLYGGNKIRKLEYLLAAAQHRGAQQVVTFGGVGSNHALATALHSRQHGLDCQCWLLPQRLTGSVAGTLQRHQANASDLFVSPARRHERLNAMRTLRDKAGSGLSVVPLGGTSPLGSIGYVNAAFELAEQWRDAPPSRVYVASGTMGTAAGLAVGFALLGWPTKVVAVRVTQPAQCSSNGLAKLCRKILHRLHACEPRIDRRLTPNVELRTEYLGEDYADPTRASQDAVDHARQHWRLSLETTYTGKVMACLLDELKEKPPRERWLYWHTYSGPAAAAGALEPAYESLLSLCRSA